MPVYKLQNKDFKYKNNRVANTTLADFPSENKKTEFVKVMSKEDLEWLDNCLCYEKPVNPCKKCTILLALEESLKPDIICLDCKKSVKQITPTNKRCMKCTVAELKIRTDEKIKSDNL